MDETPEELEQIRREAERIDVYKWRKRRRLLAAVGLGALGAGLVWVVLEMSESSRNPCQRVRDHYCKHVTDVKACAMYEEILKDSREDESPTMRGQIRAQCVAKIRRLEEEDGIKVK